MARTHDTPRDPVAPRALRATLLASALTLAVAAVAATIRVAPWALDPQLSWSVLRPFARSLAAVTAEAALLMGWPVGWALAAQSLVERGEARLLGLLGEPPHRTLLSRLRVQAAALSGLLAFVSLLMAREATAPGRVVNDLLASGRASCASAEAPGTQPVPFVSATWLCGAGAPRLAGRAPVGGFVFSAREAAVSDDLRRLQLVDATLAVQGGGPRALPATHVRVERLVLRGMAPWARASALPALLRSLVVVLAGLVAAAGAAYATLATRPRRAWGPLAAVLLGASGPAAALATLRALELRVPEAPSALWLGTFTLVPVAAGLAVAAVAAILSRLPTSRATDS